MRRTGSSRVERRSFSPVAVDLSLFARYRPSVKVTAALNVARTVRGRNPDGQNVGADPRLPYTTRDPALDLDGTPTLIGVRQTEWLLEARAGYEVLPGLVAEGALVGTSLDGDTDNR